jgi:hypothetical protein
MLMRTNLHVVSRYVVAFCALALLRCPAQAQSYDQPQSPSELAPSFASITPSFDGRQIGHDYVFITLPAPPSRYPGEQQPELRVFGFTEREALEQSGDPDGSAFSKKHTQGDLANRWAHAAVVKMVQGGFSAAGFGKWSSALLAASIMLPKEFLIDRSPSGSDLVIADVPVLRSGSRNRGETAVFVSLFGDGAVFLSLQKGF